MIEKIIELEWEFFQEVENIGGRASCQDDYPTFFIMRASQFEAWNADVISSYLEDLLLYKENQINPIYLKYAYMMASNDPDNYIKIKDSLPPIDQDKQNIVEEIITIQLRWKEQFNKEYPTLVDSSRVIYSHQDTKEETSFETYLRGELYTYLDTTLYLYGKMIIDYVKANKNITTMITQNTAKHYQTSLH